MLTSALATIFETVVVFSTVAGAVGAAWVLRSPSPARPRRRPRGWGKARALLLHPLSQLLFVCGLLVANQVLCHAYVLRAHGGDARFVTRYLGAGWFALASGWPVVRFVAERVGDASWLAPTVLRVQAFLELPFTIFAYLAVARLLGRDTHRRLVRAPLLALASASFSITFSLVELSLPNPWTRDDLVLRAAAAIATPLWVSLASRAEGDACGAGEERPSGALGLFAFLAGAGAIAYLVLAVYDALLLYNLAHLGRYARGLVIAVAVAIASSAVAPRVDAGVARRFGSARSPAMDATASALVVFTVSFFVPSLALRYWGAHASAVVGGLALVAGSAFAGLAAVARRAGDARAARDPAGLEGVVGFVGLAFGAAAALAAGVLAGGVTLATSRAGLPELALARASLAFLAVGVTVFRGVELVAMLARHEAKAQADEA